MCFFVAPVLPAAEDNLIDSDLDSLFDEAPEEAEADSESPGKNKGAFRALQDFIMGTGFGIDTSYDLMGGYLPGWSEAPWYFDKVDDTGDRLTNLIGAKISATIGMDIQPSRFLRVRQSFTFSIPSPVLTIKEFFFDYNFRDRIFVKVGKYDIVWGVSPNYPFANLLARIPLGIENPGEPLLAKVNIPVGIGGFELLMLTRPGYIDTSSPRLEDFGQGGKFNLALRNFDLDIGLFYFESMPMRSFLSFKTTLFKRIEFYMDTMINIYYNKELEQWGDFGFSVSAGFFQSFFRDKFRVNAEFYYNGEGDSASLRRNSLLEDEPEDFMLFDGLNFAGNISIKPGGIFNRLHIFLGSLYSF
ncbi:MAG: hypothetical protein LBJ86_04130, partial [Spirochaetaceae bacterium]|nr:hypothetical protein [Spirochaetaceae bacterium]